MQIIKFRCLGCINIKWLYKFTTYLQTCQYHAFNYILSLNVWVMSNHNLRETQVQLRSTWDISNRWQKRFSLFKYYFGYRNFLVALMIIRMRTPFYKQPWGTDFVKSFCYNTWYAIHNAIVKVSYPCIKVFLIYSV